MKFAVESTFSDYGNVTVRICEVSDDTQSVFEERSGCDYYLDVFETVVEAEQFLQEAKNA